MAEQLAENYHNTWGRKKKQELEAKGEGAHPIPAQTPLLRSSLVTGSGVLRAWVRVARLRTITFTPLNLPFCVSQFSSVAQSYPTLCDPMDCSTPGSLSITNSQSLLKLMSIELVMPSNHLILCGPLLLFPSPFPSIGVFSNGSVLHIRWPSHQYWSSSFSISPFNEYSGLISFRMDLLDLLAVQGTLKRLLQHHSSKASIIQCSTLAWKIPWTEEPGRLQSMGLLRVGHD